MQEVLGAAPGSPLRQRERREAGTETTSEELVQVLGAESGPTEEQHPFQIGSKPESPQKEGPIHQPPRPLEPTIIIKGKEVS